MRSLRCTLPPREPGRFVALGVCQWPVVAAVVVAAAAVALAAAVAIAAAGAEER